jgi:hypothetical protein
LPRATFSGGVAVIMLQKRARLALNAALMAALKNTRFDDLAFVKRWIDQADDPVIEGLGVAIAERGDIGRDLEVIYRVVIAAMRQARQTAEEVKTGRDPTVDASEKDRAKALELAKKADDLATFFRDSGVSGKLDLASLLLPVFGKPNLASLLGPRAELAVVFGQDGMMSLQQLAKLHEREASLLRRFASKEAPRTRTRISRQRRGREQVAFMHLAVRDMRELCGAPQYDAVAVIANIAFPNTIVTAENVRAACRPTTRSGRRLKATGTLNSKI